MSKTTVFGATGGIGQLISNKLVAGGNSVQAVTRDLETARSFPLLDGCDFVEADARRPETLGPALASADNVVISVGTTAFPTKKWKGGNDPKAACFETVKNIVEACVASPKPPKNVVLLSSIGVDRTDQPPFSILNSFGVLDAKKEADDYICKMSEEYGFNAIVVRPGRLVGEPFTNFDLAKLLGITNEGKARAIVMDTRDVLAADTERADVATAVVKLLSAELKQQQVVFSIVNAPGPSPDDMEWGKLLSLFTVPQEELLTTRSSV
jgi:nucleoside-diphosphate-sugar epimerase